MTISNQHGGDAVSPHVFVPLHFSVVRSFHCVWDDLFFPATTFMCVDEDIG